MNIELIALSATEIVRRLSRGELTPHDCLDALEARIAAVDPHVNALPTLCFERARKHADALMALPAADRGLLCGLPVPIKDLSAVAGVRSTSGSPIFADLVPVASDVCVEQIEASGGIVYAKSNTPEFGAGGHTFNPVFGMTLNPHNLGRSAAGSSGGAAAALAAGMAWVAHGSDVGGSLRNPASFCGIAGMRPSPGRVANNQKSSVDQTLGVQGPMARNVEDLALMFDAMTGDSPRDMLSKPKPPMPFADAVRIGWKPKRVAYSENLGITPVDREVAAITRAAALKLEAAGVIVEEAHPDFSAAHECFHILRAHQFALNFGPLLANHRHQMKDDVIWNIEAGLALSVADIAKAEAQRAAMTHGLSAFFQTYDLLLCPATIVTAFPVDQRYVAECDGQVLENYVLWLSIAYAITLCGAPAVSLPCGYDSKGLPVGVQIVAPSNADARALMGAKLLEDLLGLDTTKPIDPKPL